MTTEIKKVSNESEGKPRWESCYMCPVCDGWIPNSNIAGCCPSCGSFGFRTLEAKRQRNKDLIDKFAESGRKVR